MRRSLVTTRSIAAALLPGLAAAALLLAASGCTMVASGQNAEGVALYEQGNYQAAADRFLNALQHEPRNSDALYNLGSVYFQAGLQRNDSQALKQAEDMFNRCLDVSPDHQDCHRALAVLLAKTNRKEQAFTLLQRWAQRRPDLVDPRLEMARLYQEYGDRESAKHILEDAIAVNVNDQRIWRALGAQREADGDYAQAMVNYQRSLALNPNQPDVGLRLAALQRGQSLGPPLSEPGNRWVQQPAATPQR